MFRLLSSSLSSFCCSASNVDIRSCSVCSGCESGENCGACGCKWPIGASGTAVAGSAFAIALPQTTMQAAMSVARSDARIYLLLLECMAHRRYATEDPLAIKMDFILWSVVFAD